MASSKLACRGQPDACQHEGSEMVLKTITEDQTRRDCYLSIAPILNQTRGSYAADIPYS